MLKVNPEGYFYYQHFVFKTAKTTWRKPGGFRNKSNFSKNYDLVPYFYLGDEALSAPAKAY